MNSTGSTVPALAVENLRKTYAGVDGRPVEVLKGASFSVAAGEVVAVTGSSGSGKSTLLHAIGGLDACDSGAVRIEGVDLAGASERDKDRIRNRRLGFVYQFHHLLPEFTAQENVAMPLLVGRRASKAEALAAAAELLARVGLQERLGHLPGQLSGGERQRTAIARAMAGGPALILADEPTGNLDHESALSVFKTLLAVARTRGTAVVIVTHDRELAGLCDRQLKLEDGLVRPC